MAVTSDTSKLAATIVALLAKLRAEDNLEKDGVQISDGVPGEPADEMICIRGATDWSQEWVGIASGTKPKEESFGLQLYIRVLMGRGSNDLARARAFYLLGIIEDALRNDPEITNTVWVSSFSRGEYVNANSGNHAEAQLHLTVDCRARI